MRVRNEDAEREEEDEEDEEGAEAYAAKCVIEAIFFSRSKSRQKILHVLFFRS